MRRKKDINATQQNLKDEFNLSLLKETKEKIIETQDDVISRDSSSIINSFAKKLELFSDNSHMMLNRIQSCIFPITSMADIVISDDFTKYKLMKFIDIFISAYRYLEKNFFHIIKQNNPEVNSVLYKIRHSADDEVAMNSIPTNLSYHLYLMADTMNSFKILYNWIIKESLPDDFYERDSDGNKVLIYSRKTVIEFINDDIITSIYDQLDRIRIDNEIALTELSPNVLYVTTDPSGKNIEQASILKSISFEFKIGDSVIGDSIPDTQEDDEENEIDETDSTEETNNTDLLYYEIGLKNSMDALKNYLNNLYKMDNDITKITLYTHSQDIVEKAYNALFTYLSYFEQSKELHYDQIHKGLICGKCNRVITLLEMVQTQIFDAIDKDENLKNQITILNEAAILKSIKIINAKMIKHMKICVDKLIQMIKDSSVDKK